MSVLCIELLYNQANIECRYTLKCVSDVMIPYSEMLLKDKYSELYSIEFSGVGFDFCCGRLDFIYRVYFEQGVP